MANPDMGIYPFDHLAHPEQIDHSGYLHMFHVLNTLLLLLL